MDSISKYCDPYSKFRSLDSRALGLVGSSVLGLRAFSESACVFLSESLPFEDGVELKNLRLTGSRVGA